MARILLIVSSFVLSLFLQASDITFSEQITVDAEILNLQKCKKLLPTYDLSTIESNTSDIRNKRYYISGTIELISELQKKQAIWVHYIHRNGQFSEKVWGKDPLLRK